MTLFLISKPAEQQHWLGDWLYDTVCCQAIVEACTMMQFAVCNMLLSALDPHDMVHDA